MSVALSVLVGWLLLTVRSSADLTTTGLAQLRDYVAQTESSYRAPFEDCTAFGVNSGSHHAASELATVVAAVSDIVVFRCQSAPGTQQCNSMNRYFAIGEKRIANGVIRLDPDVAVLHLCVSAETNGTYIQCICQQENSTRTLDSVYLVAAKRQTADSADLTCWYDNGETLSCHWDSYYNGWSPQLEVNWTATYAAEGAEDSIFGPCVMSHPRRSTSCTIMDAQPSLSYYLNVTGVSALGEINLHHYVRVSRDIVKPPPVRINRVSTTATSIELEFQPQSGELGSYLWYLYTAAGYECEAMVYDGLSGTAIKDDIFIVNGTHSPGVFDVNGEPVFVINITDLLPFQMHRVRLRCRIAEVGRFWSDSVYESAETKEAAPSVGPAVSKTSGYSLSRRHCTNGWYGYHIYWQGIRQERGVSNGLVAYYTVLLHLQDDGGRLLPRTTSVARVASHERQAWICLRGDRQQVVTVHAATIAGVGPPAGALVIPPRSKVEELAVKPCRIFVRRGNDSDVHVFLKALPGRARADGVTAHSTKRSDKTEPGAVQEQEIEKDDEDETADSNFWTVAWCQQADGDCKGDIEHRRAVAGSSSLKVKVNGSAMDYLFGIAQTVEGQSGGITWAECSHDTMAGPSEMDAPDAFVKHDGVHVRIKRSYCSAYATPEEPQVLSYCPAATLSKGQTKSVCNALENTKESATKLNISICCQGDVITRVLDSCEESVILPLVDNMAVKYFVWLSYSSATWKHLSSSVALATWAEGGTWTVEIICTVAACAAVAGGILLIIAYRKLRPNMKLGKIYRVPPLREANGVSTTLFDEGTEKNKEYFPMMSWQVHVNVSLDETGLRETQQSPSFSEESGDSGLSSFKSRGPAQAADDREAAADSGSCSKNSENSRRGSVLLASSTDDYDNAEGLSAAARSGKPTVFKPAFRNAGYQSDAVVDAYFKPLCSVDEREIADDHGGPACDVELAKYPKPVASKVLIASCGKDSTLRKPDQWATCRQAENAVVSAAASPKSRRIANGSSQKQDDLSADSPARSVADQHDAGLSTACNNKTCRRSREWSCDASEASSPALSPDCQCMLVVAAGLPPLPQPDDDYCYAGNKPAVCSINPRDDLSDSAGSSSSCYVKCAAQDGDYDNALVDYDDDVGDEPAVVDISQFF